MKRTITQIAVMSTFTAFLFWRGHTTAATVLGAMTVLTLLLAAVAPGVLRTFQESVERFAAWLFAGIGLALLTIVYLTLFTAGALLLKVRRRDPMNRRFPTNGASNWCDRADYGSDGALYGKQYTRPHARPGTGGMP